MTFKESASEHLHGFAGLNGDELATYIRDHDGVTIDFDPDKPVAQSMVIVDAIHQRLHGHFEAQVHIGPHPENPGQMMARICIDQGS